MTITAVDTAMATTNWKPQISMSSKEIEFEPSLMQTSRVDLLDKLSRNLYDR